MVNLTIRLSKSGGNSGLNPEHNLLEADEAPLPSHLVDSDLPVVKGIGFVYQEPCRINFVGIKAQRKSGERVHICLRCNFPIAVYGRLDQCQHVLCFSCAKSDPTCFLCKERVVRIQKVDVLVGIFICGVPGCLRSFLARPDFEWHVAKDHSQPLQSDSTKGIQNQSQVQPHHAGQLQTDPKTPGRNSSANLQMIIPRKEDSQWKQSKVVRQEPQGPPAQPTHGRDDQIGQLDYFPGYTDSRQQQRRGKGWDSSKQGQKVRESSKEHAHEGQNLRDRDRGSGTGTNHFSRKRERDREPRGGQPLQAQPQQREQSLQAQPCHQPGTLPPPPPYPPPNYPSAFPPLHEPAGYPLRLDQPQREFYSGMAVPPPGPVTGMPQQGGWPVNLIPQDGFSTTGCPRPPPDCFGHMGAMRPMGGLMPPDSFPQLGPPRPHFLSDQFSLPILAMPPPMSVPRFHDGHQLPPPPPGPPPQRATFTGPRSNLGVDYGWGPGNPGCNFGAPRGGHHVFAGWLPPANS